MRFRMTTYAAVLAILLFAGTSHVSTARSRYFAPVTISAERNLQFSTVYPGVNKTISITDAGSGKWHIQGDANAGVTLTFTNLPNTLTCGGNSVPISYGANAAGYCTSDDPASATTFDPSVGTNATLSASGDLYVWIGGTVQPSEAAPQGAYTGTITLDVVYQ